MKAIKIKITRYISDDQPGFVECKFYDALNSEHIVLDKVPIVTNKYLDTNSEYPQDGLIACEIIDQWKDPNGKTLFTVNTTRPLLVETIEGLTEFNLFEDQLTDFS